MISNYQEFYKVSRGKRGLKKIKREGKNVSMCVWREDEGIKDNEKIKLHCYVF